MDLICRVCSAPSWAPIFCEEILGGRVNYYECSVCGYVQTELPYWLDKAYSNAINSCDTGILFRNQINVGLVLATLSVLNTPNGRVIDCAGGYGILVRLLRDRGIDAFWSDPYCKNLVAVGFEHKNETAELVTAFEAFEHFVNPLIEAEKLFSYAPNLLISTELIPLKTPSANEWWYYGLDHGQHIGFFRIKTLQFIAQKFGKYLVSDGVGAHLFSDKPINSIYWNWNVRIARRFPFLYGRKLRSRIWDDFKLMSDKT